MIVSASIANNGVFGLEDRNKGLLAPPLEPQISAQRQANVVALGDSFAKPATFNTDKLLDVTVVVFNQPSPSSNDLSFIFLHGQGIRRPKIRL